MRYVLLPAAMLALAVSCSSDNNRRNGGETGMANGAGGFSSHDTMPSPHDTSATAATTGTTTDTASGTATPAAILSQMNVANTTEIQLSTLAAKQASSPQVKQVARKLMTDHRKNLQQVQALAKSMNVKLTPAQGGSVSAADSAAMPADLQGKKGREFDQAFVQHEINDHQSNIEKLQTLSSTVQNPQLKSYLQRTVTEMQGHLRSLQQAQQRLTS